MRKAHMEDGFQSKLFGLFDMQPPFNIKVQNPNGALREYTLKGVFLPQSESKSIPLYSFRAYPDEKIAIIEYNSCGIIELAKFNTYIDSVIQVTINNKIEHLFIDISRNVGGSSNTNYIFFSNINHKPHPWTEEYTKKISIDSKLHTCGLSLHFSDESEEVRISKLEKMIESGNLNSWQRKITRLENGSFYKKNYIHCNEKVNNKYSGKLYVIQSHKTFSAGVDMSAWFKYGKVGTIIGTESGGSTKVYIEGIPFKMPNSHIMFRIADNFSSYPNGDLHKGIIPDVDLGEDFYRDRYELDDLKGFIVKAREMKK